MICLFGNYCVPLIFVCVQGIAHAHEYLPDYPMKSTIVRPCMLLCLKLLHL
jgi:hypothetical protein